MKNKIFFTLSAVLAFAAACAAGSGSTQITTCTTSSGNCNKGGWAQITVPNIDPSPISNDPVENVIKQQFAEDKYKNCRCKTGVPGVSLDYCCQWVDTVNNAKTWPIGKPADDWEFDQAGTLCKTQCSLVQCLSGKKNGNFYKEDGGCCGSTVYTQQGSWGAPATVVTKYISISPTTGETASSSGYQEDLALCTAAQNTSVFTNTTAASACQDQCQAWGSPRPCATSCAFLSNCSTSGGPLEGTVQTTSCERRVLSCSYTQS